MKAVLISLQANYLPIVCAVLLLSCNPKNERAHEHAGHDHGDDTSATSAIAEPSEPQFEVNTEFQKQLGETFTQYVSMKDAFVTSDARKVQGEAKNVSAALNKVDMKLLEGAAHNDWMNYLERIQKSLHAIQSSDDIETQRKEFSTVSDDLYKSIKAFGLAGKEAFYDFCPMAFDNAGGYWLSDKAEIRNPYFGEAMLTCGAVTEKLK